MHVLTRWLGKNPGAWAFLAVLLTVLFFIKQVLSYTQGFFVYPLDDTYIHLALAKTLVRTHTWGLTGGTFGSASSSPGWTIVLAFLFSIFGIHLLVPLLLNFVLAAVLIACVHRGLQRFAPSSPAWCKILVPLILVFAVPIPNLVFLGMEHLAQTLCIFCLLLTASLTLSIKRDAPPRKHIFALAISAAACGAIRYESVFAIVPVCALLLLRVRVRDSVVVALSGAFIPVIFGIYSHHLSGYWLPLSVLAKAGSSGFKTALLHPATVILGKFSHLPLMLPLALVWIARRAWIDFWRPLNLFVLLSLIITTEHLYAAVLGWLMRYESYFVFIALFALLACAADSQWIRHPLCLFTGGRLDRAVQLLTAILLVHLIAALLPRARAGVVLPSKAACDRFDEHIQMARFVHGFYNHSTVVLDDVGAVAFYTDSKVLDMIGLGSVEPQRVRSSGRGFDSSDMEAWADREKAPIAITQDVDAILTLTPKKWILLQQWRQPRNVVFGDRITAVYATSPSEVSHLCVALHQFRLTSHDQITTDHCPDK